MATNFTDKLSQKNVQDTLQRLRELGGGKITEETGIAYHDGRQILLPRGMSYKQAAKLTQALAISMEEVHAFQKTFKYRPWDGAYALQETLKELFGLSGMGRPIHTMFGSTPPEYRSVEVGPGQEVKVPWGHIDFPPLEGLIITGAIQDPKYGYLFSVTINAPKKYDAEIEGLFVAIEDTLRRKSIYKGKAIVGVGKLDRHGYESPSFLDPFAIKPSEVAYKKEVFDRLVSSLWGPMKTAQLQRAARLKLNRKTLLYGPYGTGKSLAGGLTARAAVNNGWTFIQTKTGEEDLSLVLNTAALYAPAVVFIEDIDTLLESDDAKMAELLELFDGVSSKDKEVMVLMTSNHIDLMSKGMMRAGRIDSCVEISDLDEEAIRKLINNSFGAETEQDTTYDHNFEAMTKELTPNDLRWRNKSRLAPDVDFEAVYEAMSGYEPAFIMGTFNLAKSNAIVRTESLNFELTTEDFVLAADTLRNQHDTHLNALDRPPVETVGKVLSDLFTDASNKSLESHRVEVEDSGDIITVDA